MDKIIALQQYSQKFQLSLITDQAGFPGSVHVYTWINQGTGQRIALSSFKRRLNALGVSALPPRQLSKPAVTRLAIVLEALS